jgi:hypothetical protein
MLTPRQIFEDNTRPADLKQLVVASQPHGTA